MPTPSELAAQRTAAIADLEQHIGTAADEAQQELYARLLAKLNDIHANPDLLPTLLAEYHNAVLVPLVYAYGQAMLHLPELSVNYFQALDVAGYRQLKAPLTDFLTARLGIDGAGNVVPGGYLDLMAGNTAVSQQVLSYAYQAQASGLGLQGYRAGLNALVLGGDQAAQGLVVQLYRSSGDDFSRNDRALQTIGARELGLGAFLYQGGLIDSSRPFCVARNGKCFTDFEVRKFGSKADAYGGYVRKAEGYFSGKTDPYDPFTDCGGYACRHGLHAVSNITALRMRADLAEDKDGKLYIAS